MELNMSCPMFLDVEPGMGIWTRHQTEDGKVYYYNMKRNESRWESDFSNDQQQAANTKSENTNLVCMLLESDA